MYQCSYFINLLFIIHNVIFLYFSILYFGNLCGSGSSATVKVKDRGVAKPLSHPSQRGVPNASPTSNREKDNDHNRKDKLRGTKEQLI